MEQKRVVANARQRVRDAVRADIVDEARRQITEEGAGVLSLRAVARELGMASSAVYRYFPSRDELLTTLIVESYDALGAAAETAAARRGRPFQRWQHVCRAIRQWAIDHPHEYVLLYGSPVPGYQAPPSTLLPAGRVTRALASVLLDAHRAGELDSVEPALPRAAAAEVRIVADRTLPGLPLATVARAIIAWTQIFGQISFELFGRFEGTVEHPDVMFEYAIATMAIDLGLRSTRESRG